MAANSDPPATPRWVKGLGLAIVSGVLLVVAVMLSSGGRHGPGMHTGTGTATDEPSRPTASAAAGVGGPADADRATRAIELSTKDSMAFDPSSIEVAAGETVTFVVTNTGKSVHEFTLGDAAMQREHAEVMAHMPSGMAHDLPNSVSLQPGETKQLTWQFGQVGTLEYACHEPGYYAAGMRGQITVS